jgi:putative peptidoglycan lipid II flippase
LAGLLTLGASFGIYTLAICMLIGIGLELLTLVWTINKKGIPFIPQWTGLSESMKQVIFQYKPMLAGQMLMWSAKLVDRGMAATLAPGSVAALNYGTKIVSGVKGIGAMALGRAILPYFSKMVAKEDWEGVSNTLKTYFLGALAVTIPLTALLIFLSEPVVQLIFQRGSFNANDTVLVAEIQAMYFLQMPFYILNVLGVRLLSSLKENQVLMKVSAANLIVNVSFNVILMKYMGVAGIALSTSIGYMVSAILIYVALVKNCKKIVPQFSRS